MCARKLDGILSRPFSSMVAGAFPRNIDIGPLEANNVQICPFLATSDYSRGWTVSNEKLALVSTVDALVHVVRVFHDESVPHSEGTVDSERDKRNLDYELMLADIASIEKRMERLEKDLKKIKNVALEKELAYLQCAKEWLE